MNNSGIFLSLGSNIGDRKRNLENGIIKLKENEIKIKRISSVYETEPVGYKKQNNFFNIVIEIDTKLTPFELLEVILRIEKELGRERKIHWGPRIIDIDIILYKDISINQNDLIIPHKEMHKRKFVLFPLKEIASSSHLKKNINEMIKNSNDTGMVVQTDVKLNI